MSKPERDPFTGHMTTGHEWNGIKELLTPVPKLVWFFLILTTVTAISLWVLLPTWPYGSNYTRGVLNIDQQSSVSAALKKSAALRAPWEAEVVSSDFSSLSSNPQVMSLVETHGARLYSDNCAACHGVNANGGEGYPSLIDAAWLWGGDADTIMETLRVGINTQHDDTRNSQMMAFGETDILSSDDIRAVTKYVQSLSLTEPHKISDDAQLAVTRGQNIFEAQCVSCHGKAGQGSLEVGAPDLTDQHWIYGGNDTSIYETIDAGRMGVMPHWEDRLSLTDRKILTLYVLEQTEPN